jgi:hypothetical protein
LLLLDNGVGQRLQSLLVLFLNDLAKQQQLATCN